MGALDNGLGQDARDAAGMLVARAGDAVRVRVPASTANLGPGFDCVGMALGLWDEYDVALTAERELVVQVTGEGADEVPRDARHLVVRTMLHTLGRLGVTAPAGMRLVARNAVPHSRGLGSSATAIVGGVLAAQAFSALARGEQRAGPVSADGTIGVDRAVTNDLAAALEGHPDNSSASIFGGATISWTEEPCPGGAGSAQDGGAACTRTAGLALHPAIAAVVYVPSARLDTSVARAALPATVPHEIAAANSARAALLSLALTLRPDLLLAATQDRLHQEFRRRAYPQTMDLVDLLRSRGLAACVSGAGPSVLVLTTADALKGVAALDAAVRTAGLGDWERITPGIPTSGATASIYSVRR